MEQFPLVSIVLATYNGERFLEAQLDSIVKQTYPNLEIVAVDDRSTDTTLAILNRYAQQYPFIRVIVNKSNLGYVRNFAEAMSLASGELIALSDQDDIWHLDKIRRLVDARGDAEVIYADSRLINDQNEPLGTNYSDIRTLGSFADCLSFVIGNNVSGHCMLVTRSLVNRSQPFPNVIPHDHWLCFVATIQKPLRFLPQALVDYRQHTNNVFGITPSVNGVRRMRVKKTNDQRLREIRERMRLLYEKCPPELTHQKQVLGILNESYQSFSLRNNYVRMMTFFRYQEQLLATKKRTQLRKWLFCLKMFVKIR